MKTTKRNTTLMTLAAALLLAAPSIQAEDNTGTGGTITYTDSSGLNPVAWPPYAGGYVVHKFTNSGTLNIPVPASADVLVVGGGGGGGGSTGGGGGAGGYIYSNSFAVAAGNTTVTVGAGGPGGAAQGTSGGSSVFGILTAVGGGGGGANQEAVKNGKPGGSGGGASRGTSAAGTFGAKTSGQGSDGGYPLNWGTGGFYTPGGGGGAFAAGVNGNSQSGGAAGGAGVTNSISGTATVYAGGGGGGVYQQTGNNGGGLGGSGIGGRGGCGPNSQTQPTSGAVNTGSGGGGQGGNHASAAGTGGSGIVIVRYPYDPGTFSITLTSPANGQSFSSTASVSATASFGNGTAPYTVNFYLDGNSTPVSTTTSATSPLTVNLGVLSLGSHTLYATATDSTSTTVSSATHTFTVETDTTAPTPNPMSFAVSPAALDTSSIVMTATTATDALTPPVEYYFENTTNSNNSGWISSPTWTNTGLTPGTTYGYRVKARDAAAVPNETAFSAVLSAAPARRTLYWDGGTADIGSDGNGASASGNGTWNTTIRNWDVGAAPHVSWTATEDTAIFGGAENADRTATLSETINLKDLTFDTTGTTGTRYTIAGGTLNFAAGAVIRATNNQYDQTITSAITGSPAVQTKDFGAGNTYLGLKFAPTSGTQALGAVLNPNNTGSTDKAGVTFAGSMTGNTVASIDYAGGDQYANTNFQSGGWTVAGNLRTGTVRLSGGIATLNGTVDAIYQNFVFTGGTLAGTGNIRENVTVPAAGNLSPGDPTGMLTVTGTLDVSALANGGTGKLQFGLGPIAASDKIAVTGTLAIGGNFLGFSDFNFTALTGLENGTYTLITTTVAITGGLDTTPANLTGTIGAGPAVGTLQVSGNGMNIELVVSGVGSDSTPPVWAVGWPKADTSGTTISTGFNVRAKTDEAGTAYYVVLASGATDPTSAEVKAGTGNGGATALKNGSLALTANTEVTGPVTGLSSGTTYDVWFVAEDATPNLQVSPTKVTVTTLTPYQAWAGGTYSQPLTAKLPGDNQDGDTLTNLQEYAFGTQPTVSTGEIVYSGGTLTTPGAPKIVGAAGTCFMVFGRRADYVAAGLTYTVQFSAGLDAWVDNDDVANPPVQVATDGTINAMSVPFVDLIVTPSGSRKPTFARVKVTMP